MRNLAGFLFAGVALFLLATVVLPLVGFLLAAVVAVLAVGAAAYLAAPYLARLPWFRDRIRVEQHGGMRTVRFGRTGFTNFRPEGGEHFGRRRHDGDIIDVEGRQVAVEDEPTDPDDDLLPPPGGR